MSKQIYFFPPNRPDIRQRAQESCWSVPDGYMVTFREATRTLEQNAKFHAICADIANSGIKWAGKQRTAAQWKVLLVSGHAIATNEGSDVLPGLEGEFINLRESTALMSKKRGASLIEYALAWAAMNGVVQIEGRDASSASRSNAGLGSAKGEK